MAGAAAGSGEAMATSPRLSGRRLQTLAVIAGKACSGWPKASSDSGWTWYCRFGVSTLASERAKTPTWLGAIDIGPVRRSAYSRAISALPQRVAAVWLSVFVPSTW